MDADSRSIPELVSALTGDLADLVRKESELVRTEVAEKLGDAAKAGQQIGIGGALLLGALLVLLQALVLALSKVIDPLYASLVVGIVVGLLGFTLIRAAGRKLTPAGLAPQRAARQIQKDAQLVKDQVQ